MFTSSGLLVRFLKVFERSNYQSVKWVRYLTKANGSYQIVRLFLAVPTVCRGTDCWTSCSASDEECIITLVLVQQSPHLHHEM